MKCDFNYREGTRETKRSSAGFPRLFRSIKPIKESRKTPSVLSFMIKILANKYLLQVAASAPSAAAAVVVVFFIAAADKRLDEFLQCI